MKKRININPKSLFKAVCMATCIIIVGIAEQQSTRQAFLLVLTVSIIFLLLAERRTMLKNNFAENDNKIYPLLQEISQLYQNIDSAICHDLKIIKSEIMQINEVTKDASQNLTHIFFTLNEYIVAQKKSIELLCNSTDDKSKKHNESNICKINDNIHELSMSVIRLLQFEDIVSQIASNGIQHITSIESYMNCINIVVKNSINNLTHTNMLASIHKTTEEISNINLSILQNNVHPIRKATKQMDMSEGSVELF